MAENINVLDEYLEKEMKEVFYELKDLFYDYHPNDETFLETYPELAEKINKINDLEATTKEKTLKGIEILCGFLNEWFPDSVTETEQKRVSEIINKGYKVIKKIKK